MDPRQRAEILGIASGRVEWKAPMARRTTFRVGGNAEALCEIHELGGLSRMVSYLNQEGIPYLVVGRGSNLLVQDGGIRGVVIRLSGNLGRMDRETPNGSKIMAGAGLSIVDLLIACRRQGLSGLEFLAGIPGTVGGAVAMNAGAFGEEIGSYVQELRMVDSKGNIHVVDRSRLTFLYRRLELETGTVIAQAAFGLNPDSETRIAEKISGYLKRRKASQPLEYPSAGSVFRNPPDDYAGRLIEQTGLKGRSIGGAVVSERHANFIVNKGGASASDILALIDEVRERVRQTTGVAMKLEIRVVGEPPGQDVL